MIEKFLIDTELKDREHVEECAKDFAKPTREILLIGLFFGLGSTTYSYIVMKSSISEPYKTILLIIPWLVGFIIGPLIWKKYGPNYKQLIKKHFGKH